MYNRYPIYYNNRGFLGPFLLGGITGGLISPLFYNNQNIGYPSYQPYYNNYYYYPYYGPYYRNK